MSTASALIWALVIIFVIVPVVVLIIFLGFTYAVIDTLPNVVTTTETTDTTPPPPPPKVITLQGCISGSTNGIPTDSNCYTDSLRYMDYEHAMFQKALTSTGAELTTSIENLKKYFEVYGTPQKIQTILDKKTTPTRYSEYDGVSGKDTYIKLRPDVEKINELLGVDECRNKCDNQASCKGFYYNNDPTKDYRGVAISAASDTDDNTQPATNKIGTSTFVRKENCKLVNEITDVDSGAAQPAGDYKKIAAFDSNSILIKKIV